MRDPNRKVIYMLWTVITILIIGGGVIGYMLYHKADELTQTNEELNGNNLSLREQLRQAKASPSPSATPIPTATPTPSPTASATPSPTASATPKP